MKRTEKNEKITEEIKDSKKNEQTPDNPSANLEKTINDLTTDLQRTRADFENYRKQMDAQKMQAIEFAKQDTVKKFLPLLDDLDRAINATPELSPLAKNLEKTLGELGLSKINSEVGADFNPDLHDAVMMEESDGTKEVVAETLRAGYTYAGVVIRPAMVKVKNV